MASRAELLEKTRKQREQRELQRQRDAEERARRDLEGAAALLIQRRFRGASSRQHWLDADWKSLSKQVHDLETLAELVRKKGQQFVAPCRVLLPLLSRTCWHGRRPAEERADLCAKLGAFAVVALRAPLTDAQRGACAAFAASRAPHVPDPRCTVSRFAGTLLSAVLASSVSVGTSELAELLECHAWGEGRGLRESDGCRRLAAQLLVSAVGPVPGCCLGAPRPLTMWRASVAAALAAWPGGSAPAPPRLLGLVGIGAAWLRLAGAAPRAALGADPDAVAGELMEAVVGVPRIGRTLSAKVAPWSSSLSAGHGASAVTAGAALVSQPVPWAWLLESYARHLEPSPGGGGRARALDREYTSMYAAGNLWEVHAAVGLPLEPLLVVQARLVDHLEVSLLPGYPAPSVDEPVAVGALREQLRHFADAPGVAQLFSRALCLQARPSTAPTLPASRQLRPYQRHCVAVAMLEVSAAAISALCRIYSTLLMKARAASKVSRAGWGKQVYHGLANAIAFSESGDVARCLWRCANGFFDWRTHLPLGVDLYHVLHVQTVAVSQQLSVISHDELLGSTGPLPLGDLRTFISKATALAARLIWDSSQAMPSGASGLDVPGAVAAPAGAGAGQWSALLPKGPLLEALLEQLGKVLAQFHSLSGRLSQERGAPPRQTWHAPAEVLQEFRQGMEQSFGARASAVEGRGQQRLQHLRACAERLVRCLPHSVPFEQRVFLLRSWIQEKHEAARSVPPLRIVVRRSHIFEDGLEQLAGADWRARFQVVFVNALGRPEQGQDVGGLFKEFWEKLAETAFNPDYGLFRSTESRLLYPNPEAAKYHVQTDVLFAFLGLVIGKAIYEGIVVEPCFAPFFLAKLLGRHNSYYDLQTLDPSLFANLERLKNYTGDVSDLCCSFVANASDGSEVPLLPNGQNITVTNDNRFRYVYMLSDFKLNTELKSGCEAFVTGFSRLLEDKWLRMFGEEELQQIISGSAGNDMDVEDLQRHTQYSNCGPRDRFSVDFFKAVSAMRPEQRVALLRFATSCSRTPLLGFSHLVPPFTLHKVHIRSDSEKLPTASTCFNMLKLPTYSGWTVTKKKLEFVIEQGAGFELD